MEKTKQFEIENDYKNQLKLREDDLKLIGEYEAQIKQSWVATVFNTVFNYIFSAIFYLLFFAGLIILFFFFPDIMVYFYEAFDEQNIQLEPDEKEMLNQAFIGMKYILTAFTLMSFIIASLIMTINKKSKVIRKLNTIVSTLKINAVDQLEEAKRKYKLAREFILENRHRV